MDVMIDIETMATVPNSLILTIGAIKFDRREKIKPLPQTVHFYKKIKPMSGIDKGLVFDDSTMVWWQQQPEQIRQEAFSGQQELDQVLKELSIWLEPHKYIWSQGSFDINILSHAYNIYNLPIPWKYYAVRDTRTAYDIFNVKMNKINNHNALQDCYNQIITLQQGFLNT